MPAKPNLANLIERALAGLGDFQVAIVSDSEVGELQITPPARGAIPLVFKSYRLITPARAEGACKILLQEARMRNAQPLLYAAAVSDRTAEIAKQAGVSWMDFAGNCVLQFPEHSLYVQHRGIPSSHGKHDQKTLKIFSPRSSRVPRAMLQEPQRTWQVNELAKHPDVKVSPGLVSRIKGRMVDEGYVVVDERRLRLKRPKRLLDDWVAEMRSTRREQVMYYMRGGLADIEAKVADWLQKENLLHALSHLAAGWRIAPEVRYSVTSFLLAEEAWESEALLGFEEACGARRVESGANLTFYRPLDESQFANLSETPVPVTSALQTYLDLRTMDGRGQEAADTLYDQILRQSFDAATRTAREL
ncbi:hypothetical protein SV7mr_52180 [Stieleria bergensis]|uniref:HTH crp-type domain-containing protein n=1 Tax=Stieleria bergensis TaxID=2528025 RepID=A0A517T2R3_9BACT|nr:hypothetical protein SV7mr_52180 [Planctomycetes bacterium SV_7m_r]